MKFYCTAGRGTEEFVANELEHLFDQDVEVTSTDGKTYFDVKGCPQNIKQKLLSLKTAERMFVEVLHENYLKSDRRGLLTLLHTKLGDQSVWNDCISTLDKMLGTGSPECKDVETDKSECIVRECSDVNDRREVKRRKLDDGDITTFRISCRFSGFPRKQLNLQKTSKQMGVLVSKLLGWKIDLRQPRYEINIYLSDNTLTVGIPLTTAPLSKRSYIKHCGLRTPVAWIMASLLDIIPGDVVLDPMCGTGTILIEASHICQKAVYIGMDNDTSQLKLAAENIEYNNITQCSVTLLHGDVRHVPILENTVDKVVTDAPFGQNHTVAGVLHMFYNSMLSEIIRVVKPGGMIIVLTSTSMAPYLHRVCERYGNVTHKLAEASPSSICDTNTSIDVETLPRETTAQEIVNIVGEDEHKHPCDDTVSDWSSSVHLQLKATYNVKLGETEGCIFVMQNLEKIKK